MAIRVVRLGAPRANDEGLRLGTVRRPPRGVPKSEYASRDYYDVWLPQLAPSSELVSWIRNQPDIAESWSRFAKKFRKELSTPDNQRLLDLLAAFSKSANFSVGCFCEDENICHRSILREVLASRGALLAES